MGRSPGFLSRGISLQAKKASKLIESSFVLHNFLLISAIAVHGSSQLFRKLLDLRILLHPIASSPEGPDPPFVFAAAVFIDSAVIDSNRIGCTFSGISLKSKEESGFSDGGYFCLRRFRVLVSSGSMPFCMLSDKSRNAEFISPFKMKF